MTTERIRYESVRVTHIHHTLNAVLVKFPDLSDNVWLPRTLLSHESDKLIDTTSRNEDVELDVASWKLGQLGVL